MKGVGIIFNFLQGTIIVPAFLFMSYSWSCAYIVGIFIQGVWNGASYYIEVFSKRCLLVRYIEIMSTVIFFIWSVFVSCLKALNGFI